MLGEDLLPLGAADESGEIGSGTRLWRIPHQRHRIGRPRRAGRRIGGNRIHLIGRQDVRRVHETGVELAQLQQDWIVALDGDGQCDPRDLGKFLS